MKPARLIFCCGTGGVGKTTVSAAVAIRLAQSGSKTIVLTIDPSKRLRTAMGLRADQIGLVDLSEKCPGLSVYVPDARRTFEALLRALAPDQVWLDRMMQNTLFQTFSGEYSGAHEFLALVLVHDLVTSGLYDTVVIDTPPSQNAAAFFQAPERMQKIFDEQIVQWITKGLGKSLTVLQKLLGQTFLGSMIEFFQLLHGIQAALSERLARVQSWIPAANTEFWLVSAPSNSTLSAVDALSQDLNARGTKLHRCIVNRTLSHLGELPKDTPNHLSMSADARVWYTTHIEAEGRMLAALRTRMSGDSAISLLPEQNRDVHSWEDLQNVANVLAPDFIGIR